MREKIDLIMESISKPFILLRCAMKCRTNLDWDPNVHAWKCPKCHANWGDDNDGRT